MPLLRPTSDGKLEYKPLPRQKVFFDLPHDIFEALYGGAVAGGKTDALIALPIYHRFHENHAFKGLIMRPTYPQLEKEIIPRSHMFYPKFGGKYNEVKKRWTFPSGAMIYFGYATSKKQAANYDGTEWQFLAFDELQNFTEEVYIYLTHRMRSGDGSLEGEGQPILVRSSAMPGGEGLSLIHI